MNLFDNYFDVSNLISLDKEFKRKIVLQNYLQKHESL